MRGGIERSSESHGDFRFANGRERFERVYFVILSISAISSALSAQPIAFTFCSTCSTRVAPAMTLETCGRDASQENASSSMVWPRALREGLQLLDDVLVARRDIDDRAAREPWRSGCRLSDGRER